jgi:hypothetical protein
VIFGPGRRLLIARTALATGAAVIGTGCGKPAAPPPAGSPAELAWIDNASDFIARLDGDVALSAEGGGDLETARRTLEDESNLVTLLMANVAFGSCQESLRNVGVPTLRLQRVETTLASACRVLQRAARLFTRAATNSDPRELLAASRTTLKASPLLHQAKGQLADLRAGRPPRGQSRNR